MAAYGYEVASEDDAYVKLIEKVNLMTVEPGAPGSTLPDLFPICEQSSTSCLFAFPCIDQRLTSQCDSSQNGFLVLVSSVVPC